ncbi:MAG: PHP domain-containing protein [Anaerolineaceae bacterium]|jgi:predicted metal-dependent phosphoesterase TrpH|nr:MAG: PHP domain-containing protein [Anaerolineaceae bacterium]
MANKIVRAEFHCHSIYSSDSINRLERLLQTARENGIERLCITDHDTIAGALKAHALDADLVVVSEEVLTASGELIAYFLQEEIPAGLPALQTIALMKEQGAFITIPHPCDAFRAFWKAGELEEILPQVDAVEVFNARCFKPEFNERALELAEKWNKPFTVGSDAHTYPEVGLATLSLPDFHSSEELRRSIREARMQTECLAPLEHIKAAGFVKLAKLFSSKKK